MKRKYFEALAYYHKLLHFFFPLFFHLLCFLFFFNKVSIVADHSFSYAIISINETHWMKIVTPTTYLEDVESTQDLTNS